MAPPTARIGLNTNAYGTTVGVSTYTDQSNNSYLYQYQSKGVYYYYSSSVNNPIKFSFPSGDNTQLVSFESNTTTIPNAAFFACIVLTSVTLTAVSTIAQNAFAYCSALPSIALPATITSIANLAFFSCTSLVWIYIPRGSNGSPDIYFPPPDSISGIGIFNDCPNLIKMGTDVYGDAAWTYFNTYLPSVRRIIGWPCFLENTKILCLKDGQDTYLNVQDIRKGTLVKTLLSGYVPVDAIGTTQIFNSGDDKRSQHRLYTCTKANYPELTEDLVMTGCHSILVDTITDVQRDKTIELLGRIFVTDKKYRLMACVDERSTPYDQQGTFNIYHLALENTEYYQNYGIYANGLLVETCSKRYMKELSGMTLLG